MKRFLINFGFFFAVLFATAWCLDKVMTDNLQHSNARVFNTYNVIYNDNLKCDVVIMGSSRGQVQYDPAILDSIIGLNCYNISVDGRCIDAQVTMYGFYCHHALKPKYVIQNIEWGTVLMSNGYEREQYLPYLNTDDMYEQTYKSEGFTWVDRWLPLIRYAGYHEVIKEGLGFKNNLNRPVMYKGFIPRDEIWDGSVFRQIDTLQFTYNPEAVEIFDSYLMRCQEEGVRVVLVYAPIYIGVTQKIGFGVQEMFDFYQSFADRYEMPILDYTYDSLCYDTNFFYNATHLNKTGAEIFTSKLAMDLRKLFAE